MDNTRKTPPLYFEAGWARVTLSRDFYHNCITKDPFPHNHPIFELHYIDRGSCSVETKHKQYNANKVVFYCCRPGVSIDYYLRKSKFKPSH